MLGLGCPPSCNGKRAVAEAPVFAVLQLFITDPCLLSPNDGRLAIAGFSCPSAQVRRVRIRLVFGICLRYVVRGFFPAPFSPQTSRLSIRLRASGVRHMGCDRCLYALFPQTVFSSNQSEGLFPSVSDQNVIRIPPRITARSLRNQGRRMPLLSSRQQATVRIRRNPAGFKSGPAPGWSAFVLKGTQQWSHPAFAGVVRFYYDVSRGEGLPMESSATRAFPHESCEFGQLTVNSPAPRLTHALKPQ